MVSSTLSLDSVPSSATVSDLARIFRAIASSTAIETGQTIQEIESQLYADSLEAGSLSLDLAAPDAA